MGAGNEGIEEEERPRIARKGKAEKAGNLNTKGARRRRLAGSLEEIDLGPHFSHPVTASDPISPIRAYPRNPWLTF